jgi:signal transduction histidine kinase
VLEGECNNVDDIIGITIYRIIQEALNNISIHAGANRVLIKLSQKVEMLTNSNILLLNIDDDGKGFNPDQQSHGFGLLGMYERADAIGGELSLYSEPGRGTQIKAKFPT